MTMTITRNGKIARLPREIREQLNIKLDDGMEAGPILEWVNELPETKKVVAELFEGKPINAQNLTEWRQGGHQDWLRARERIDLAQQLEEQAEDLEDPEGRPRLSSDRLGMIMTIELGAMLKQWQAGTGEPPERWRQLRELLHELAVLRRADHRALRAEIAEERWECQAQEYEQRQGEQEIRDEEIEENVKRIGTTLSIMDIDPRKVWLLQTEAREAFREGKGMPQSVLDCVEKASLRETESPKPKVQRQKRAKTRGSGGGGGMTNDECQMTKEARMTKSEGNRAVQRAEAEGSPKPGVQSPRSKVQSQEENEEGQEDGHEKARKDTKREIAQEQGAGANQGESNPIKANQTENEPGMGVQSREIGEDPPSQGYGAASENEDEDEEEGGRANQSESNRK
jgi:hypothetical protein